MYIIIKSPDNKFIPQYIDGKIGHHLSYAEKLAKEVNEAMVALKEVRRLFGTNWMEELARFEDLAKEL